MRTGLDFKSAKFDQNARTSRGFEMTSHTNKSPLKTCFYQSKPTVLMREMLFDNFQKVRSGLGHFLNF